MKTNLTKYIALGFLSFLGVWANAQNVPECSPGGSPSAEEACQKPIFTWEKPQGTYPATAYEFYLGTNNQFQLFNGIVVSDTFFVMPFDLDPGSQYEWIVIPQNSAGKAAGCQNIHSFTTFTSPDPNVQLTPRNFSICEGQILQVSSYVTDGQGPYGMLDFKWTGNYIGLFDSDVIAHPTFSAMFPGDFSFEFTVTDTAGCFGKATWTGEVRPGPGNLQLQGATAICRGDSLKVLVNSTGNFFNWEHSPDSIIWLDLFNQDDAFLDEGDIQEDHYYRAVVGYNGCLDTSYAFHQKVLENPDAPELIFDSYLGQPYVCSDDDTLIVSVANYTDSVLFNGIVRNDSLVVYTSGLVEAIYTAPNLCSSTTKVNIQQRSRPDDAIVIPQEKQVICDGMETILKVASDTSDYVEINWNTGHTYAAYPVDFSGVFSVELINTAGCDYTYENIEVEVVPSPDPPQLNIPNGGVACANEGIWVEVLNYGEDLYWDDITSQRGVRWYFSETGTHTVTFEFNANCRAETEFNIKLNPSPPKPIIETPGGRVLCGDDDLEINVISENNDVYWFGQGLGAGQFDSTHITITETGRYYAVFVNGFACEDTSFVDISFEEKPGQPNLIQSGDTLYATNYGAFDTFQWYQDGNEFSQTTNPFLLVPSAGSWTVAVRKGGCISEPSDAVSIAGLQELKQQFSIYPNPNDGAFWINAKSPIVEVKVFSALGLSLPFGLINKSSTEIGIQIYRDGVYFVIVDGTVRKVVVKN